VCTCVTGVCPSVHVCDRSVSECARVWQQECVRVCTCVTGVCPCVHDVTAGVCPCVHVCGSRSVSECARV
jgi:hypothetical protein